MRFGDVQAVRDASLEITRGEFVAARRRQRLRQDHAAAPAARRRAARGVARVLRRCRRAAGDGVPAPVPAPPVGAGTTSASRSGWPGVPPRRAARGARRAGAARVSACRRLRHRPARSLSGGEQQRLALARGWAVRPDILFLDEPTASLDPSAKKEVEALLADFAADGMTLVMSTHNLGQAKRLATPRHLPGRAAGSTSICRRPFLRFRHVRSRRSVPQGRAVVVARW